MSDGDSSSLLVDTVGQGHTWSLIMDAVTNILSYADKALVPKEIVP